MKSSSICIAAVAAAGLGLWGCGSGQETREERAARDHTVSLSEFGLDAEPAQGDWKIWRLPAEMPHLNPITVTDAYAREVTDFVFDGLLDRDPETLEMRPNVAHSWDISEDKLEYTFHLREDVVFSDGEPLTAHDVAFTFDIMMNPATDAPHLRNYFADITDWTVIDDHTIRFTAERPYYRHLVMIGGLEIIPRHIYSEGEFNTHPNNRRPVGSGRYVMDRWRTGQELILKRNPNYWGGAETGQPYFDQIHFRFLTDDNAAFQLLQRGDLDRMALRPDLWVRRASTPAFEERFNKFAFERPAYTYIGWNMRLPQLADKRVRRALTMLLDREAIRDEIYHGLATIVTGNFMPGTPESNDELAPWPFDPAAAAALLDEAGWTDTTGDGLRDKDGVSLRFEIMLTTDNPDAERIVTLFREELARVGVDMRIRQIEWASMIERVHARNFEAVMLGWSMPPDPDPYQVWHSSQTEAGSNYVGFVNEEADQIIEQGRVSFDRDERARLYNRFHEIVHEEQPYTFLFAPKALLALDKRIHGVRVYPFGVDPREWFVPADLHRRGS